MYGNEIMIWSVGSTTLLLLAPGPAHRRVLLSYPRSSFPHSLKPSKHTLINVYHLKLLVPQPNHPSTLTPTPTILIQIGGPL